MIQPPSRTVLRALCVCCAAAAAACGQKGPPLAPIVLLPAPVAELSARKVENEILLQFTLPTTNTDRSGPADLRRIEVYAHTGPLPAPADFLKYGTLVQALDVKDPRTAGESEAGAVAAPRAGSPLVEQGWTVSVREALTDKHREIGPMPPTRTLTADRVAPVVVERLETPGTVNFELPPERLYTVVGVSRSRGRRGPYAGPLRVPLAEPIEPVDKVEVAYTAAAITLSWPSAPEDAAVPPPAPQTPAAAPGGAAAAPDAAAAAPASDMPPAQAPAPPPAAAPAPPAAPTAPPLLAETEGTIEFFSDVETEGTQEPGPAAAGAATGKPAPRPRPRFGYNVYAVDKPQAAVASPEVTETPDGPSGDMAPVKPLNAALLTTAGFSDPTVEFGVERCYLVRRVEMSGTVALESAPTGPICVTPVDTFPPAPPKGLVHIANASGVSLLWEANSDADLGGYLVLRGEAPGDKLSPLTPEPITDTSFTDTTVRRGRTYVYEVIAVDRSTPPNQSVPSNRVEETIR